MKLDWIVFCVSTMAVASGCRMAVSNNYPICDSQAAAVRVHAAADFDCPLSDVSVRPGDAEQQRWVASGCGKSVTYLCPHGDPYGRCQREGAIDQQPVDVGSDVAVPTYSTPVEPDFRASMKLVLSSIPYKDCGGGADGKLRITFDDQGNATVVEIVSGGYEPSTIACLVDRFRNVHAPASKTGPRTIEWGIHLEANAAAKGSWDS